MAVRERVAFLTSGGWGLKVDVEAGGWNPSRGLGVDLLNSNGLNEAVKCGT